MTNAKPSSEKSPTSPMPSANEADRPPDAGGDKEMTPAEMRAASLFYVNQEARRAWQGMRAAREAMTEHLAEMQRVRHMVTLYRIDPETEGNHELARIVSEAEKDLSDVKETLIRTATAMISDAYDKGKYEGREMKALFCTMFDLIDEDMTTRLHAEAG